MSVLSSIPLSFEPLQYFRRLGSGAYDPLVVLIELLLIGSVVYVTLRFLQGTRGARLMRGIGVVVVFGFLVLRLVAQVFHWERIEFLYQYFVGALFLITLVVFQPELRRGFMRIGERLWFSRMRRTPNKVIDPVVTAAAALSKKHIGALIAIERVSGHAGIVESGVILDARLSPELLSTIFWPGSALHDMGVIIRDEVILAAACQFPLAESGDLDRSLGSRHRAALGLSQESDAVVVVVSEETGAISVAHDGRLERGLTPDELRARLHELLVVQAASPPPPSSPPAPAEQPAESVGASS